MKIQLPEHIDSHTAKQYILTIEVHPSLFSFSLYSPVEDSSYFYHPLPANTRQSVFSVFREAFFDNEFFSWAYRKVFIINYTSAFTYIPAILFKEKDADSYMQSLLLEQEGKTLTQKMRSSEIVILHQMNEEAYRFLSRSFSGASFLHHSSVLITYFQDQGKMINGSRMIVNKRKDDLDILCFSRDGLLLVNHFHVTETADALYYILFIWKQFKFNQLKDFIFIGGDRISRKELMEEAGNYIRNLVPVNIVPDAHFSEIDTQVIPLEIAALSLCDIN